MACAARHPLSPLPRAAHILHAVSLSFFSLYPVGLCVLAFLFSFFDVLRCTRAAVVSPCCKVQTHA